MQLILQQQAREQNKNTINAERKTQIHPNQILPGKLFLQLH